VPQQCENLFVNTTTFNLSHGSISNLFKNYKSGGAKKKRSETSHKYKQEVEDRGLGSIEGYLPQVLPKIALHRREAI